MPVVMRGEACFAIADVSAYGDKWQGSSTDVHVAGLGWIGVGLSGGAQLRVWAPRGVAITTRDALVPDYAETFERPGFSENTKQLKYEVGRRWAV